MVEDQSRMEILERQAQILKEEMANLRERLDCSNVTANSLKLEMIQRDQAYRHKCDELVQMQDLVSSILLIFIKSFGSSCSNQVPEMRGADAHGVLSRGYIFVFTATFQTFSILGGKNTYSTGGGRGSSTG